MAKPGHEQYTSDYEEYLQARTNWINQLKNGAERYVPIGKRDDTSLITQHLFKKLERGKYMTDWRGVPMSKDPLDLSILQAMLWDIKPRTVIELGTMAGGSALWLADHVQLFGLACHVIAFDQDFSKLHEKSRQREDVTYLQGDSNQIEKAFPPEMLRDLPHPWIIIEDAHANVKHVLEYFHMHMKSGDYFVVEDGHPATCGSVMNVIRAQEDITWGNEKMNVTRSFLEEHSQDMMVDTYYTDRFGYNTTFNLNGFIRKM